MRYQSINFSHITFSLQNKRKSLRRQLAGADIIHSQCEIEVLFSTLENSPFPLAQSIKIHRRALDLILCHHCEKSSRESCSYHHLITQHDNIHLKPTKCMWICRIYVVKVVQFVLKIEKLSHICVCRSQDLRSPSPIMAPGIT